jgi:NADP-dependent 3-hydroxy acid dehydrogenase YdfG
MPVDLAGGDALVAGASQGIGRAIASALVDQGMRVWLVARRQEPLDELAATLGPRAMALAADLTDADQRAAVVDRVTSATGGRLDVLVLTAGLTHLGRMDEATIAELDEQLQGNVVAPYGLTQALLPTLRATEGQVVFVNSSAGKSANAGVGQYSASMHASAAMAASLRAEVNDDGIRVTVVHPGRTATPRQESIHRFEGRAYRPELLLQPDDVAEVLVAALRLPRTAELTELSIRPMRKS